MTHRHWFHGICNMHPNTTATQRATIPLARTLSLSYITQVTWESPPNAANHACGGARRPRDAEILR